MSKFIFGVLDLVSKECKTAFLVKKMDISHLMAYAGKFEKENLREKARKSKRSRLDSGGFFHQNKSGHNKF